MKIQSLSNLVLCIGFAFLSVRAEAQDPAGAARYVIHPKIPVANGPGGSKLGEVYVGTPVVVQEQRGSWTRVTIDAWVRSDSIAERKPQSPQAKAAQPQLTVVSASLKEVTDGVPAPRMYVKLRLKNTLDTSIGSWNAMLVARKSGVEQPLFRERISDSSTPIPAGGEADISFFWETSETPYALLKDSQGSNVTFELFQIKLE